MTLKNTIKISIIFTVMIISAYIMQSCKVYSFTGTSLSPDLKTFSVNNFTMGTAGGPQNMAFSFNEKLKEYYQRNTDLKFKSIDGDLHLEGSIIGYELLPISATSGDKAAVNRLSITVEVRYANKLNEEENFDREFSFYQDFPQEKSLSQVEDTLVPKIIDQLVLNIFNATAASW